MGAILNYILSIITGDLNAVKNWIAKAIQTAVDFLTSWINSLWHDTVNLYNDAIHFVNQIASDLQKLVTYIQNFVNRIFADFVHWVQVGLSDLNTFINQLGAWIVQQVNNLLHLIGKAYQDIEHWVMTEIWNPLWTDLTWAIRWIETEGAYVYNLLTHPELLAEFLGAWIWKSWLKLIKSYGSPIARWLLHTMLSESGAFADVLETILSHMI